MDSKQYPYVEYTLDIWPGVKTSKDGYYWIKGFLVLYIISFPVFNLVILYIMLFNIKNTKKLYQKVYGLDLVFLMPHPP